MTTITAKDLLNEEAARFAKILCVFKECSPEIQDIIYEMAAIFDDEEATEDEKTHATDVITEALFPKLMDECVELDERALRSSASAMAAKAELDEEEAIFAENLHRLMAARGMSQEMLAQETGVSQPAISNMLNRNCRPQRRTILRLAEAFNVSPEEVWPDVKKTTR